MLGQHGEAIKLYDQLAAEEKAHPRPLLDNKGTPPQVLAAEETQATGNKKDAEKRLLDYLSSNSNYADGRYSALSNLLQLEPTALVSGTISPLTAANIAYKDGYFSKAISYLDMLRASVIDPAQRATAALLTGKAYKLRAMRHGFRLVQRRGADLSHVA